MQFGRPEQFHDKVVIRLRAIERAIAQYQFSAAALKKPFEATLTKETALYLKGFGNEVNLLAATRELYFASRELLDVYLGRLGTATARTRTQVPKDCVPFLKRLAAGDFDHFEKPIFTFCKTNLNYLFHIRKIRNELKSNPSAAEFTFDTDHFMLRMALNLRTEEVGLIEHLDIVNLDEVLKNKKYFTTINLDVSFPEMRQFWTAFEQNYDASYAA